MDVIQLYIKVGNSREAKLFLLIGCRVLSDTE